jgi:hypothetical protein
MATTEEIQQLRGLTAEPDSTTFSDEALTSMIDQVSDQAGDYILLAAASVWDQKAAMLAGMVDVSESGSSRKNSDLFKNANAMQTRFAARYKDSLPAEAQVEGYTPPRVTTAVRR